MNKQKNRKMPFVMPFQLDKVKEIAAAINVTPGYMLNDKETYLFCLSVYYNVDFSRLYNLFNF